MSEEVEVFELPEIICLEDFGGDINTYLEEVYAIFKRDFVDSKPTFEGTRLGLKKHPEVAGKAYTFYHMTHTGKQEDDREPDLRRCERIGFPRPMIDNSNHPYLKVWRKNHKGHNRILIYHEEEEYLVVLEDRGQYILPWTAYLVTYKNQRRRLMEEYEAYKNAETAQGD